MMKYLSRRRTDIALMLYLLFAVQFFPNPVNASASAQITSLLRKLRFVPIIRDVAPMVLAETAPETNFRNTVAEKLDVPSFSPKTGGPGQPEMNSFRSVGADNMVNLFTGDFSYNIPLLDVGGYPVNLFYNAGISMDQEATWVGLGWNINPGTITRNMRGLPDDFDGSETVEKIQSMKPDLTVGVTGSGGAEVTGVPGLSISMNTGIFYNNRRGLGLERGIQGEFSVHKMLSKKSTDEKTNKDTTNSPVFSGGISAGLNLNSQNGMTANAGFEISKFNLEDRIKYGYGTSIAYSSRQGLTNISLNAEVTKYKEVGKNLNRTGSSYLNTNLSFAHSTYTPSIRVPLTRVNHYYAVKLGSEQKVFFPNGVLGGYVTESRIDILDEIQRKPAFGYMHYEKANDNKDALLDFNRINDGVYTYKTPVISAPVYTYDVFSINGEGTGGSFRGYRGNVGYTRDHESRTKSGSVNVTLDIGGGDLLHTGTVIGGVYSPSKVSEWQEGNSLREAIRFNEDKEEYQTFYFKNPGEKAIIDEEFYNTVGADKLVRPYLVNTNAATPILSGSLQVFGDDKKVESTKQLTTENNYKKVRDKRSQVITYLTAGDADLIGLDKYIYSYTENVFKPGSCTDKSFKTAIKRYNPNDPGFYRKAHHLSEITVLESDGKRYVYGIPVYQVKQKEVSFSTDQMPDVDNEVSYQAGVDNSIKNEKGRDGLYQSEEVSGYAHAFLLTAIVSPDFVDVKGDGISDDDLGTAVKFNYSRVNMKRLNLPFSAGQNIWGNFKWRMPLDLNEANYNEGLKTDIKDDKALYAYGEKELWYLHTIESKNMVATFHLSNRNDGRSIHTENGGFSPNSAGQKKLDKINLYTKADYAKYGAQAKPVKTVHFSYTYELCKNYKLNSISNEGKLTLKSIWFTYNGKSQQKNKYLFSYDDAANSYSNPDYKTGESDRWGNYKPSSANLHGIKNNDFPYTKQDPIQTNQFAGAWNLKKILLPSGAMVKIDYEADDYAFVQDRRASQMTKIAGFGKYSSSSPSDRVYTYDPAEMAVGKMDHKFVFFDVSQPVTNVSDIPEYYLNGLNQLLLKLWVKMPTDNNGGGYEPIIVYSIVKSYGVVPGNNSRIYFELEEMPNGGSPIVATIIQFLKDNLPSKAYKGYDVKSEDGLSQIVGATWGMMNSLVQAVRGFERDFKSNGKCREALLSHSYARLNNPNLKKLGGGHRVKRVTIYDNWDKMTEKQATGMHASTYGQEYDYSTKEVIGGIEKSISSGVASYEPGIGNEENPFREVLKYSHQQFLGPTDHSNIELPIAESLFPSPMVGYSKVSVRSIHNKQTKNLKSGIGYQTTEFYTSREFPVISDHTSFDVQSRKHQAPKVINRIFNFNKNDYLTLTQGFRIILNDMNGKMKSQSSYTEFDDKTPISYTAWYYKIKRDGEGRKRIDNALPVIQNAEGHISSKLVGKDVELMVDFREHFSYTWGAQIPLNLEFFTAGPVPMVIPTVFRMCFRDKSLYRSATSLKVVNEYGILDSVVNIDKGSVVGTKNLVYDAENGNVLLSRVDNQFSKQNYQFNYPAAWLESGMDAAYKNIDVTYTGVNFKNGLLSASLHVNKDIFESGDEIFVQHNSRKFVTQTSECILAGNPFILPRTSEYRIWAIDIRKDLRNTEKEFLFLDRHGNPYNADNATIRIVRSGKRNIIGASVGNVLSLENPITTVGGVDKISFTDATNVINAGAVEYKERWKANDMFYTSTEMTSVLRQAPVNTLTVSPETVVNVSMMSWFKLLNLVPGDWTTETYYSYNPDHLLALAWEAKKRRKTFSKSWVNFDLSQISSQSNILSASLSLYSHKEITPTDPGHTGIHRFPYGNHTPTNPHAGNNIFAVSRLLHPWPGDDENKWTSILFERNMIDRGTQIISGPTAFPTTLYLNDKSFCNSCGYNASNNAFNVTNMIRGMIQDRDAPAKGFASAIQIEIAAPNVYDQHRRVCFNSGMGESQVNKPVLTIKYYNCAEAYGLPGNAATPPAGQETTTCISNEMVTQCLSVFSKTKMNPYIQGVLGNWRSFKSYVYYDERRESDASVETNIRKDGAIKNFESFWSFNSLGLAKSNSNKWVWNSQVTQYNRKGAELENKDALNRFNAGIYGYQESLPIAVVNNSPLRLSAYDGFEDYGYQDDPCEPFCKPNRRHFKTSLTEQNLDHTQSHTGASSVKVGAGTSYVFNMDVSSVQSDIDPDIRIKLDKTAISKTTVAPAGYALKGYYYHGYDFNSLVTTRKDNVALMFSAKKNRDVCDDRGNLPPGVSRCGNISVQWKGRVQAPVSGQVEFSIIDINNEGWVFINNALVCYYDGVSGYSNPVTLTAGELYDIKIDFKQERGPGNVILKWRLPNGTLQPIDKRYLYPEGEYNLATGTVTTTTVNCVMPDIVQVIKDPFIEGLSLLPDKKMVMSLWVKKGGQDCKCSSYNANIVLKDAANNIVSTLLPKERIIEGWQQYEAVFTVPATTQLALHVNGFTDVPLYLDDLRIQPFNSNMKSFVYDPVTLRLMSELDENNYASFYEYDDEGTLIRLKKETKEGIKTISETRSSMQKKVTSF